ncbi:DUF6167 family protein [Stackebrandtia nassauensis]|uniref:Secreted protein n=1 Tax=Stackebrandtia nassauensis (strain DSM 44728 / CIP 108903 / NRRL B-16338 / NBRC 102104 / LLR-40K-21) TaxID=446470 RepID=D3PYV1_STANL|nr:DUF6167 family protein [Stackebrandtia nassauensis]ADD43534.1 hypothetical protein Snas_3879 [Stackebrandtia nassauensis DSM 44728]
MVKRLLWLAAGVAVGVIVVRKLARGADALSPAGIGERLRNTAVTAGSGVRSFMSDVGEGMHEKEAELHEAIAAGEPVGELLEDDDDR